ncbi:MAG TPA: STAS domain-containing protein [Tahibacter sp.]|uniref:STAS domain-containing protein n=1 Tax=Tahibacter sp. TaxID=2056211 RepID=UPI002C1C1F98|nr:STAS domain-containing protein [Tahibacter sp.]HSX62488.1 STAS domain-containing protein [Tahibacter sp.]
MSAAEQLMLSAPAPGVLAMSGALVFATAARALADARPAVARGDVATLDLSAVTAGDSAGLAVVLALRRAARSRGGELAIVGMPATLRALAQLGEVEELLGIR